MQTPSLRQTKPKKGKHAKRRRHITEEKEAILQREREFIFINKQYLVSRS